MKIGILSRKPELYSTRRLVESGDQRGHDQGPDADPGQGDPEDQSTVSVEPPAHHGHRNGQQTRVAQSAQDADEEIELEC